MIGVMDEVFMGAKRRINRRLPRPRYGYRQALVVLLLPRFSVLTECGMAGLAGLVPERSVLDNRNCGQ